MKEYLARLALQRPLEVGILLFQDVEVLDFAGPFEVFSVAARIASDRHPLFRISTISSETPVMTRHGLTVAPSVLRDAAPAPDILIVPGGVVDAAMADKGLIGWIAKTSGAALLTASVCTGAFLLAKAGVLRGRVTTHWEDIPALRADFPVLTVEEGVSFVDQGGVITSAGISAGIDMSLYLVGQIAGEDAAMRTARQMQYRWP